MLGNSSPPSFGAAPERSRRGSGGGARDPLEHLLAFSAERVLGVEAPALDDAFQSLGVEFASAARWTAALQGVCEVRLATQEVLAAGTLRELAWLIRERARAQASVRLRSFAAAAGALPFFFVPGDPNGAGLYCTRFAQALGPGIALHALMSHGPYGPAPLTDVSAMAAFHIETLRAAQPRGPYSLGGFCLGGIVAFEMARQLEAQGARVTQVVMIGPTVWSRFWGWRRACGWLGRGLGLSQRAEEALFFNVRERVQPWFARWDRWRARRCGIAADRFPEGAAPRRARDAPGNARGTSDPREAARADFWVRLVRTARLFAPGRWDGPTVVLWPERERLFRLGDPQASWRRVATRLEVYPVPGGHIECLVRHVDEVGRIVREVLHATAAHRPQASRPAA